MTNMKSIVLGFAAALTLVACSTPPPPPAPPPVEVGVLVLQPSAVAQSRDLVGRLTATRSAQVRARVPGILLQRVYAEGSDVAAGDVLFKIDPKPLEAELNSRKATLAQRQADAQNARSKLKRVKELSGKGVMARQDMDDVQAAATTTAAAVKQAEADVENARLALSYATVTAPIAGRAGRAMVTEGALVGQGDATVLTTVEQLDPLFVEFSQSVAEVEALRQAEEDGSGNESAHSADPQTAAEIRITLPGGAPYEHPAKLDFSDLAVDPQTGAMALRATIANPERRLLPGMFVGVNLTRGAPQEALLVPQAAVLRDGTGAYVLTVDAASKVVRTPVALGGMRDADWIVESGLNAGDRVIMSGLQKVRPGAVVKVAE
jgi:membrane fusion protein (multidrug efflux system)